MKIKTQLTLASVIAAGLLASGCSQQMVAQQASAEVVPEPVVKTVIDCATCNQPAAPAASNNQWTHTHPAVPNCTDSISHTHKFNNRAHNHAYSCKKTTMVAPRPAPVIAPRPAPVERPVQTGHTHAAIPNCTDSYRHNHPSNNPNHQHRYSCKRPMAQIQPRPMPRVQPRPQVHQMVPMMPKVKAKGTYRGPIAIDGMMQQYKQ